MMPNVEVKTEKTKNKATDLWRSYRKKNTRAASEAGLVEEYLPLVKTVVGLIIALGTAGLGVALARYAEADDAPGGVVMGGLLVVGAVWLAVRAVQRRE